MVRSGFYLQRISSRSRPTCLTMIFTINVPTCAKRSWALLFFLHALSLWSQLYPLILKIIFMYICSQFLSSVLTWTSLVAQLVRNPPAMQETWVPSLGWEDPLEKGTAAHYAHYLFELFIYLTDITMRTCIRSTF